MADVQVRPATTDDAAELGRIQLETWRTAYDSIFPRRALDAVSADLATARWAAAVTDPPTPRHRVLVAMEQDWRVGFVAFGPSEDEDADPTTTASIVTLLVEPRWGRRGHGSRLLAAAVEHLRADGFALGTTWLLAADVASHRFYTSAGWERDGVARALDVFGKPVDEVRLHASVVEDAA
jgi:GNAT superfamily N-acetyltransferase